MPGGLGDVNDLGGVPQLLDCGPNVEPSAPLIEALERAAALPHVDPDVMRDLAARRAHERIDDRAVRRHAR